MHYKWSYCVTGNPWSATACRRFTVVTTSPDTPLAVVQFFISKN
jgi:hypothetical protein